VKKYFLLVLLIFLTCSYNSNSARAQSVELLAGNTLNGAMNGVVLGGATMALRNNDEFDALRIGLGGGTLYGIGMGIYDITQTQKGQQFYISGTFNDGVNRSIIVLLDTFYGAAGGALIASSVSLILQEPIVSGLQYGAGAGAWAGFGFGLVDAFVLSEGPNYAQPEASNQSGTTNSLLTYNNKTESVTVGMLSPRLVQQKELSQSTIKMDYSTAVDIVKLQISL